MRNCVLKIVALCITFMFAGALAGFAQSSVEPTFVNFIADMDLPSDFSDEDQKFAAQLEINTLGNVMYLTNTSWNLFVTKESVIQARMIIGQVVVDNPNVEVGISGMYLDEKLSEKSYSEQQSILESSMEYAESLKFCGINEVVVSGFLPQSFDQNEDTYKVIDELGLDYDTGFQAGILYAPGHEEDVWPYKVENHDFYAVPISTYMLSGELVPLSDRYAKENGISASEWEDMLEAKFDEISGKDEPMIISLTSSISGSGEYLEALKEFKAYAESNGAVFVTSSDLVDMSRTGIHELSEELSSAVSTLDTEEDTEDTSEECPECDDFANQTVTFVL